MVDPFTLIAAVEQVTLFGAGPAMLQLNATRGDPPEQLTLVLDEPHAGTKIPLPVCSAHEVGTETFARPRGRSAGVPSIPKIASTRSPAPAMSVLVGRRRSLITPMISRTATPTLAAYSHPTGAAEVFGHRSAERRNTRCGARGVVAGVGHMPVVFRQFLGELLSALEGGSSLFMLP